MRITCIGGGPAGLYFALLMKKQNPAHQVRVLERNKPGDTFGWGVVFSDQTLAALREADAPTAEAILTAFNHWDDIDVHINGRTMRSSGHGFCGIGRKKLLNILQARCEQLGVELVYEHDQPDAAGIDADLIIASDGLNSRIRSKYAGTYQPDIDLRQCRFVWLGTEKLFDAFTFDFQKTEWGWFQAHAYQFNADTSTFIVETPETVWKAHGLDRATADESVAFCERLFAAHLQGEPLLGGERVTFYYLSEERVDFRDLVRLLSGDVHARVELRAPRQRSERQRIGQCLRQTPVELLRVVGHELEHLLQRQRGIPLAGDQRAQVRVSPVVHGVEQAGLLERRDFRREAHGTLDLVFGAGVLVERIALVEIDLRVFVVAHVAGFVADVLPDRADALGHARVGDAAQGGHASGVVQRLDDVEQRLVGGGIHGACTPVG